MSTFGALFSGVSGLLANGDWMGAISDGIANVNTVGFKQTDTNFATMVNAAGSDPSASGAGVQNAFVQRVDQQGLIQASTSPTDLAINGQGFFVVTTGAGGTQAAGSSTLFTRAGSFTPDGNGNLANTAGDYLQGYKLDAAGDVLTPGGATTSQTDLFSNLQTVNVSGITSVPQPTRSVDLALNLPPTAAATPAAQTTNVTIYDALGNPETMALAWNATGTPNQWTVNVAFNPTGIAAPATAFTVAFNNQGQLVQVDGNTTSGSSGILAVSGIDFSSVLGTAAAGSQTQTITVNLGTIGGPGTTQLAAPYAVQNVSQDGLPPASLSQVSVDDNGFMTATYANGLTQQIYRLPVATFDNADGLTREDGNAYSANPDSGNPSLQPANTGASGSISPSSLENSTVDLSQEFTNMIIAQRAYQAASTVVTTADQMVTSSIQMMQ